MRYSLLFLLLSACGLNQHPHQVSIDPAAQAYVNSFQLAAATYGRSPTDDLIVTFTDLYGEAERGVCHEATNTTPHVEIDSTFWRTASDSDREQLVYHELGHCLLNRGHIPTLVGPDQHPVSLMLPVLMPESVYQEYHDYYIQELFND